MAEGALVGVAKGITEKASNLLAQEIVLLWGVKDEIERLGDTVLTISAVIEDAEEEQHHNNQVRVWLKRLNDALYEADDLLDDISTEALRREVMTRNKRAKEDLSCGPLPLSQHLIALRRLIINGSNEFDIINNGDEMEWHGLQRLRYLKFYNIPNLATLPMGIQHLTSLQRFKIYDCPNLLAIPEWISNLTSLQTLKIRSCPILLERCKKEAGEDWPKIAHIPYLDI